MSCSKIFLLYLIIIFINLLLTLRSVCDRMVDANFVKSDGFKNNEQRCQKKNTVGAF